MNEEVASRSAFLKATMRAYIDRELPKYEALGIREFGLSVVRQALVLAYLEGSGVWQEYNAKQRLDAQSVAYADAYIKWRDEQ